MPTAHIPSTSLLRSQFFSRAALALDPISTTRSSCAFRKNHRLKRRGRIRFDQSRIAYVAGSSSTSTVREIYGSFTIVT
jgi:hypothetical protein